ncbi:MAG: hypothetical protein IMF15_07065 [Proteobacteria bacterium]|nr:hypothetical protein [Pseudomonadota bacterium]
MPDYDPKSIPILDDIIDNDVDSENTDTADTAYDKPLSEEADTEILDTEDGSDDNTLDLFKGDAADIDVETVEPEITAIDTFNNNVIVDEPESDETKSIESALIDYQPEEDKTDINDSDVIDYQPEAQPAISIHTVDSEMPVDIDAIVDDVVKQMMPDLEQQLRFLIQQALEEKLGNSKP